MALPYSRAIGMGGGSLISVLAQKAPELFGLCIGRVLNRNGTTFCDDLSRSVRPCYSCETRTLEKR